jgi:hypothetical protein
MTARVAATAAVVAVLGVGAAHASSGVAAKPCGGIAGPTAHASGVTFRRYTVMALGVDCAFARKTVAAVLRQRLPNSLTPVRAKAPAGWVCVAQEVDTHVPATGHCQQGRSKALAWVPYGIHP